LTKKLETLQGRSDSNKNDIQAIAKHLKLAQTKITTHEAFINNDFQSILENKMNEAIQRSLDTFQQNVIEKLEVSLNEKISQFNESLVGLQSRIEHKELWNGKEDIRNALLSSGEGGIQYQPLVSEIENLNDSIEFDKIVVGFCLGLLKQEQILKGIMDSPTKEIDLEELSDKMRNLQENIKEIQASMY